MKRYRLRHKEQDTLTAILNFLICEENAGRIAHCDRLNSGVIYIPYTLKSGQRRMRRVKLCREGTPDCFFVLNTGEVIWVETKSRKGEQRYEQRRFQGKIGKLPKHEYWVIRGVDDFIEKFKQKSEGGV